MSKCQTVQDELKINQLVIRKKADGKKIERKVLPARSELSTREMPASGKT
jgi:hypothetical protein